MSDGGSELVFKSTTNVRDRVEHFFVGVICMCIGIIVTCPCWFGSAAIVHVLGKEDFTSFLVGTLTSLLCCILPILFVIISVFNVSLGPSFTRVTLTFDGRVIKTRYATGFGSERTISLSDVNSIARHTGSDYVGIRRIFGRFNPAKPGVIVKTAGKSYSINTEEFDEFADVIKKYKPEVEISG